MTRHFFSKIVSGTFKLTVQRYVYNVPTTQQMFRLQSRCTSTSSSSKVVDEQIENGKVTIEKDKVSDWMSKVVFQDDNLIAISKSPKETVYGQYFTANSEETEGLPTESLVEILPQLAHHLNIQNQDLQIGLSLKSYFSGLVLLTKNPEAAKQLKKVLSGAAVQKECFQTYLAVSVGTPQVEMNQIQEMYLTREYLHNRELSVVSDRDVKSARKEGKMIKTSFKLKIISSNEHTQSSLVEVKIDKDKWDAIQVLLSHYLSPVLGDTIYSSRTNYLMGVPFASSPYAAFPGSQRLPKDTENALQNLCHVEKSPLPLFLHRHKVTLTNFPHRSSVPLEITAPPPMEFLTVLECLGLHWNECR